MGDRYNLYPLHVFRTVAQHGTVSRAAESLFISQPAVSRHIRTLEDWLGAPVFDRTSRGMLLTPVGTLLLTRANALFALWEGFPNLVGEAQDRVQGLITIAASSTPGAFLLPALLREFRTRYPECDCILTIGDSSEVLAWIREYQVPMGVVGRISEINESEFDSVRVAEDELRLVVGSSDALRDVENVGPQDVRNHTLYLRERGSSTRAVADQVLRELAGQFRRVVEIESAEAIKEAVIAGLGVSVLSSWATRREEGLQLLYPVGGHRLRSSRDLYLVRRADRTITGPSRALWDHIVSTAGMTE